MNWASIAVKGAAAGAAGGLLLGAAILGAGIRPAHSPAATEFAALFAAASLAWGIGYASLAASRTQLDRHPVISGLAFGAVVYVVTQLVLYGAAAEQTHTVQQVVFGIAATCLLYGLPVAFVTRALGKIA